MLGTSIPVLIIIIIIIIIINYCRVHPQAIPLAMIPREKQLMGFYQYGAPLGRPLGCQSSAIITKNNKYRF